MAELGMRIIQTWTSEWDLSAKQWRAVVVSATTDSNINVASQAGDIAVGIVENKPTSGQAARVCHLGIGKGIAGAALSRGNYLGTNATGFLVNVTASHAVGYAMANAASGDVFTVFVQPHRYSA